MPDSFNYFKRLGSEKNLKKITFSADIFSEDKIQSDLAPKTPLNCKNKSIRRKKRDIRNYPIIKSTDQK